MNKETIKEFEELMSINIEKEGYSVYRVPILSPELMKKIIKFWTEKKYE